MGSEAAELRHWCRREEMVKVGEEVERVSRRVGEAVALRVDGAGWIWKMECLGMKRREPADRENSWLL